jgi:hypothetical protein
MIIATRVLTLQNGDGDVEIPIKIFAPEPEKVDWSCRFEVGWPDGTLERSAMGIDAIQALLLAMQMIGAQIYASDHHASGNLSWLAPGQGYGFPVPANIRDLLIGNDAKFY